jgi:hypothetical protein
MTKEARPDEPLERDQTVAALTAELRDGADKTHRQRAVQTRHRQGMWAVGLGVLVFCVLPLFDQPEHSGHMVSAFAVACLAALVGVNRLGGRQQQQKQAFIDQRMADGNSEVQAMHAYDRQQIE